MQFAAGSGELSIRKQASKNRLSAEPSGNALQGHKENAVDQLPAGPLFVSQSPAGKGQADEWVKKYVAMHPECSSSDAMRGIALQLHCIFTQPVICLLHI